MRVHETTKPGAQVETATGALVIRKSEWLDDWYLIERAEHDGREWMEKVEGGMALRKSSRISDADVEGSAAEMLAIADAIDKRTAFYAKRCAVNAEEDQVRFWSPRNSTRPGKSSRDAADALARLIRTVVAFTAKGGDPHG